MATLQENQARLALYLGAETKILEGNQEWEVGDERFRKADLVDIQKEIRRLQQEIAVQEQVAAGGSPIFHSQAVFGGRR